MRRSLKEILAMTDTTLPMLKALRRRNQLALAFGQRVAYESMSYLDVDAVAMLINDTLALSFDRPTAAMLTRIHFNIWGRAVALAEEKRDQPALFCIVELEDDNGVLHHLCAATRTTDQEEIARQVEMSPQALGLDARRIVTVNVQRLIRFIREKGARYGIDLDRSFLPPPGSPAYEELFAAADQELAEAIAKARTRKVKEEAAQKVGGKTRKLAENEIEKGMWQ